jgi:hypothetical protein
VCCLLECVRKPYQPEFAPGRTNKGNTQGQPVYLSHRHRHTGVTGRRGQHHEVSLVNADARVEVVDHGSGTRGGRDECIEMILAEGRIDPFEARAPSGPFERVSVYLVGDWSSLLRGSKYILAKVWHLLSRMLIIEVNESIEVLRAWAMARYKIALDAVLELSLLHDFSIVIGFPVCLEVVIDRSFCRDADRIDYDRASSTQGRNRPIEQLDNGTVIVRVFTQHADAGAQEAICLQSKPEVGWRLPVEPSRGRIVGIVTRDHGQHRGSVGHGARQRTGGVVA